MYNNRLFPQIFLRMHDQMMVELISIRYLPDNEESTASGLFSIAGSRGHLCEKKNLQIQQHTGKMLNNQLRMRRVIPRLYTSPRSCPIACSSLTCITHAMTHQLHVVRPAVHTTTVTIENVLGWECHSLYKRGCLYTPSHVYDMLFITTSGSIIFSV